MAFFGSKGAREQGLKGLEACGHFYTTTIRKLGSKKDIDRQEDEEHGKSGLTERSMSLYSWQSMFMGRRGETNPIITA